VTEVEGEAGAAADGEEDEKADDDEEEEAPVELRDVAAEGAYVDDHDDFGAGGAGAAEEDEDADM
jgi:hypothetical protein